MTKVPFTKREWIWFIALLLTIEVLIEMIAWTFAGHQNAVGYVSLAGTIVSIILAVLAIVYSFIQSVSQQDSASTINGQVTQLVAIVGRIESSKTDLTQTLAQLEAVSKKIDAQTNAQAKLSEDVVSIKLGLDALNEANQKIPALIANPASTERADTGATKGYFLTRYHGSLMALYMIYFAHKCGFNMETAEGHFIKPRIQKVWKAKGYDPNSEAVEHLTQMGNGFLYCAAQFLETQGILKLKGDKGTLTESSFDLPAEFLRDCEKSMARTKSGENHMPSLKENLLALEEVVNELPSRP